MKLLEHITFLILVYAKKEYKLKDDMPWQQYNHLLYSALMDVTTRIVFKIKGGR